MIRRAPRSTLFPATTRLRSVIEDNGSDGAITGPVNLGTTVHDKATVTGTPAAFAPTGTLTYNFYHNRLATRTPFFTETVAVGSESSPRGPLAVGNYNYRAIHSGDSHHASPT